MVDVGQRCAYPKPSEVGGRAGHGQHANSTTRVGMESSWPRGRAWPVSQRAHTEDSWTTGRDMDAKEKEIEGGLCNKQT